MTDEAPGAETGGDSSELATALARIAELETDAKTHAEAAAKHAATETELTALKHANLQTKVGTAAGLPAAIAALLQGTTETELAAHAKTLVAAMPKPTAPIIPNREPHNQQTDPDPFRDFVSKIHGNNK